MKGDFSALPTWRKVIAILGLTIFFLLGSTVTIKELNIWAAAAQVPDPATGQVCALHWMHGSVRYVTAKEWLDFRFWSSDMAPLIGIPFLIAFFVMFPFREIPRQAREARL